MQALSSCTAMARAAPARASVSRRSAALSSRVPARALRASWCVAGAGLPRSLFASDVWVTFYPMTRTRPARVDARGRARRRADGRG